MRRPIGAILEMAIHKKTPILRSAKTKRYPFGITKKLNKMDMTAIEGPMLNIRCCIDADISLSNHTITSTSIVIPSRKVKMGRIHISP